MDKVMDSFFEQIVPVKKDGKAYLLIAAVWLLAIVFSAFCLFFSPILGAVGFLLIAGVIYGAIKITTLFNIEFEYIVTNGIMDIDKIINKSSRKRMISFDLSCVSAIEKSDLAKIKSKNKSQVVCVCNLSDPNAYLMTVSPDGKGTKYIVFSPDEKIESMIVKYVPRHLTFGLFN